MLSDEVGRILGIEPPVSRVDGLIALLAPERSDRRGGRSGRLGRAPHVELALRVRADRRDRLLARTTTRRQAWRPWSSREGRGSRGVGVHRSFREGPDWPALPHPSDGSCCPPAAPAVLSSTASGPALLPCWVSRALTRSPSLCLGPRSASCLAAPGAELRRRSENGLTLRSHQLGRKLLCTLPGTCFTVRVTAAIPCTICLARNAEP